MITYRERWYSLRLLRAFASHIQFCSKLLPSWDNSQLDPPSEIIVLCQKGSSIHINCLSMVFNVMEPTLYCILDNQNQYKKNRLTFMSMLKHQHFFKRPKMWWPYDMSPKSHGIFDSNWILFGKATLDFVLFRFSCNTTNHGIWSALIPMSHNPQWDGLWFQNYLWCWFCHWKLLKLH